MVNPYEEDRLGVVCRSLRTGSSRQPADGVRVERPQRSEDERPWGRQGLTQDGRREAAVAGVDGLLQMDSRGWQLHRQQPLAEGSPSSGAGHPFAAPGGMELCGRSRAGSIKRATTPPGGVMTHASTRRPSARAVHIASLGAGARQRTWPSRKP
jgi:hypothetical protein